MEHDDLNKIARQAAQETIRETFRLFGVDVYEQEQVNSMRADLAFTRHLRKTGDKSKSVIVGIVIASVLYGVGNLLVAGAHSFLSNGKLH